jgi:putative membrane protein
MPSAVHLVYLVLCGALAMSAMILPGVSGSFVLLLMGVYFELFAAIHHVSAGDINGADLSVVGAVAVGSVTGLLLFSRVLEFLFRRYHDVTVAALIGLMLGSLYGIWPFRTYAVVEGDRVDGLPRVPGLDLNLLWTAVACLAGVGVIVFFCWCERRTGARADVPPAS